METLQNAIRTKGEEIFRLMEAEPPEIFDTGRWAGKLMGLAMADPDLKVRLFRFVDVLPTLADPEQVISHIREYFFDAGSPVPPLLKRLLRGIDSPLTAGIAAGLVRRNIAALARTFIAGGSPEEALPVLERLWRQGSAFTVDILGEAALSEKEAGEYHAAYLRLIRFLAGEMSGWPVHDPRSEETFPRLNISVKVSSLYSRIGPVNYDDSVARVRGEASPPFSCRPPDRGLH